MATTTAERITAAADFHALNAMLNLYDSEGRIPFEKDRQAVEVFMTAQIQPNTLSAGVVRPCPARSVSLSDLPRRLEVLYQLCAEDL